MFPFQDSTYALNGKCFRKEHFAYQHSIYSKETWKRYNCRNDTIYSCMSYFYTTHEMSSFYYVIHVISWFWWLNTQGCFLNLAQTVKEKYTFQLWHLPNKWNFRCSVLCVHSFICFSTSGTAFNHIFLSSGLYPISAKLDVTWKFLPFTHKVKTQYLHFRSHAEYFLLSLKIPEVISRRSILFHN